MNNKTIVSITGIRPDFIRMSNIFNLLDKYSNHILIHTGQHYDSQLSAVFFDELNIRKPDYILQTGILNDNHYEQMSYLSTKIIELFNKNNISPDLIIFLGDSNSVGVSFVLKKQGYKICHIEAGMRSYDNRMLEEINRKVCDICSDILFVYHDDYKKNLEKENIYKNIYVVGNTITEICKNNIPIEDKLNNTILIDIHRPENFNYKDRMVKIIKYALICHNKYNVPIEMLTFNRTIEHIKKYNIDANFIKYIPLLSYKKYIKKIYHSLIIISDSGTAQEESVFFKVPVIVPRDFTERPQSAKYNCSYMLSVENENEYNKSFDWIDKYINNKLIIDTSWLGDGNTSEKIIDILKNNYFSK
jgi:UDP-N-acetylglucosamine 2-epimerase (non-hydrolysing)